MEDADAEQVEILSHNDAEVDRAAIKEAVDLLVGPEFAAEVAEEVDEVG